MDHLDDMFLFAKVVERGGFSAAARALALPTSKLSRRIAELEAHLGVRLLHRSTRRISVTDIGQTFYRHCAAMVVEAQSATEAVARVRVRPQGLLRVSCPGDLLHSHVGAVLARYLEEHPLVRLEVEATNRRVNVIEEGIDVALRVRYPPLDDSGLVIRPLAPSPQVLVAAPWLFAHHQRPLHIDQLAALPTLTNGRTGDHSNWLFITADGTPRALPITPRLVTEDLATLRQAAIEGLGIAYLPMFLVRTELACGQLERVLPGAVLAQGIIHAVFPSRLGLSPAVRCLIDRLVVAFEAAGTTHRI